MVCRHPIVSVDWINLLVVCWLKHYACCTSWEASYIASFFITAVRSIEFAIDSLINDKKLFSFETLFSYTLVIHQILLLLRRKILDKKIFGNLFQFAKSPRFSSSKILYHTVCCIAVITVITTKVCG